MFRSVDWIWGRWQTLPECSMGSIERSNGCYSKIGRGCVEYSAVAASWCEE